jgi:processive 1,2-diacylglycerol beta-glucosyltransferase
MINGQPLRAIALVERLLRDGHVDLTVTAGKDEGLKRELESMAGRLGRSLEVLGWVSDVPALVKAHHLLIGKAGGAMVQEALAAGTPMIITQVLPGQEEGNARLLTQNGCGVVCPTNEAVSQTVAELFSGEALGWKRMAGHATKLGRPDAARELAQWIQAQLGVGKTSPAQEGAFGRRGV